MSEINMDAYKEQINLKLLDAIISFVTDAAKTNRVQKYELQNRCVFPLFIDQSASSTMQHEYGFLYLGELLERYEERFGMTIQDRRAIALALGYTSAIATPEMFVGNQRTDFVQSVRRYTDNDIYLTGALYLIQGGTSASAATEKQLKEWTYTKTEELIFAMSLFPDTEQTLAQFRGYLADLLGKGRTIPVYGNTGIFNYAFAMLNPLKQQMRGKNMDILRALLALPVSFVKEGSKPYERLLENSYTPIEIAFLNNAALRSERIPGGPGTNSLSAERVVVSLFRAVMALDSPLPDAVYEYLTQIYPQYETFAIKCYGERKLVDALGDEIRIQTPETMAWFIRCTGNVLHPATGNFDVMDTKWDSLAENLDPEVYLRLFESCLTTDMDTVLIQERLDRYKKLTNQNYLDSYSMEGSGGMFPLMVDKGLIDLWTAFQNCLTEDGGVRDHTLLRHVKSYCGGIRTIQAFEFMRRFMEQYGFQGREQYLSRYQCGFEHELWNEKSYSLKITLNLQRDFLSGKSEQLLLLQWVDEYFFTKKPDRYLDFLTSMLENEGTSAMLTAEDRRKVFDVMITQPKLSAYDAAQLKQRCLTPEELQADQAAKKAADEEQKRQEHLNLVRSIEDHFSSMYDGKVRSVAKFLDVYRFHIHNDEAKIAWRVVSNALDRLLKDHEYTLNTKEMGCFLRICGDLIEGNALSWEKFQSCISLTKEEMNHESDGN